jgi:hypothetical protein
MGFPIDVKLLKQCMRFMTEDQVKRLAEAISAGEEKTTRFTLDEFKDLVNKVVTERSKRRRHGYE